MGFFDALLLITELAIPILLAVIAILDWRRFSRGRYLLFGALYGFLALGLLADFFSATSGGSFVCLSAFVWLVVLGIIHNRSRRADLSRRSGTTAPPA